ncbi:hypothetical protein PCCS19_36630 [Paenibacillus sp. CCS19]|uniref:S-layer homology domain-containing protein n=1 Tax=Paenibacillus sp. CCS19 TaxID=3158387 RepID=UPI00256AFA9E|nr:S-layer homology domain-containing protein [Paenibacillus cellulosilyticus]GMK40607.1 hypothetical protein PCCS19_36630 [Paenibacillus cellulosilyticus]
MSQLLKRSKWIYAALATTLLLATYAPGSVAADSIKAKANETASTVSNTAIADPTNTKRYSDVLEHAWYAEAVTEWIARGILSPNPGDEFKPQFITTRGDFAFLLAYSLGLAPSEKSESFTDLPDGDLAGYVAALEKAGLAHGYPDGTFRPNAPVTRAEAASWLAAAKKLQLEPQTDSLFTDVKPTSWYSNAVNALASTGIITGKTKDRFAPGDVIVRAETITLLYRTFYKASIIQDIRDDGTILIDGTAYRADDSVAGIFQSSNKAVLRNAAIQFIRKGDTIVSVDNLIIGYHEALAGGDDGSQVFNAGGAAINGIVTVDADQITLTNLKVKGDLVLTKAFQTNFAANNVIVSGKTIYVEDTDRPESQIANLEFQNSDLGTLVLGNSTSLNQVEAIPDQDQALKSRSNIRADVRVHASNYATAGAPVVPSGLAPGLYVQVIDGTIVLTNSGGSQTTFSSGQFGFTPSVTVPPIVVPTNPGIQFTPPPIFNSTPPTKQPDPTAPVVPIAPTNPPAPKKIVCANVNCNIDAFARSLLDTGTTGSINTVTVHSGAEVQYIGSDPIDQLTLGDAGATEGATFIGSANIERVTVNGKGGAPFVLNVKGTIGTLEVTGTSQLVLTGTATINNLIVPAGIDPKSLFANPSDLSKVSAINGQSTAPVMTPTPIITPPATDTTPPNGMSEPATAVQKVGGTTVVTVTLIDEDAAAEGVDHYRVFVSLTGDAASSDSYQQISGTGAKDIDLTTLAGGGLTPVDGQTIHLTVIAYDAAGNASIPTASDKTTVIWDKSGPSREGMSVTFTDTDVRANSIGGEIQVTRPIDLSSSDPYDAQAVVVTVTNGSDIELFRQEQVLGESTTVSVSVPSLNVSELTNLRVTAAPVDRFGNIGTAVSSAVTDWAVAAPTHPARDAAFIDMDYGDTIGGAVTWTGAEDETDIDSYTVYFLDASGAKVGDAIATVQADNSILYYIDIPDQTPIPTGVTQFGVYSTNAGGESLSAATAQIVNDINVAPNGVNEVSAVQSGSDPNLAIVKFTDTDAGIQMVSYYKVYITIDSETMPFFSEISREAPGTEVPIDLSPYIVNDTLKNGSLVTFTVVAVHNGLESTPTDNDKATVVWVLQP